MNHIIKIDKREIGDVFLDGPNLYIALRDPSSFIKIDSPNQGMCERIGRNLVDYMEDMAACSNILRFPFLRVEIRNDKVTFSNGRETIHYDISPSEIRKLGRAFIKAAKELKNGT